MASTAQTTPRWKLLAPLAVTIIVALIPTPEGLAPHAWYFFRHIPRLCGGLDS